eukprot:gene23161-biopygen22284
MTLFGSLWMGGCANRAPLNGVCHSTTFGVWHLSCPQRARFPQCGAHPWRQHFSGRSGMMHWPLNRKSSDLPVRPPTELRELHDNARRGHGFMTQPSGQTDSWLLLSPLLPPAAAAAAAAALDRKRDDPVPTSASQG